jgi:hypothetical protein
VRRKVAANLIKDANHVWAQVAFQANSELLEYQGVRSLPPYRVHEVAADPTQHSICHGQFHHPSLIDTILNATFLGSRLPTITQQKSFNPILLLKIVFACTVVSVQLTTTSPADTYPFWVYYSLELEVSQPIKIKFEAKKYECVYDNYLSVLKQHNHMHHEECQRMQIEWWEMGQ